MRKSPRWDAVTAIFGGSFDPPHRGHRIAAEGLLTDPGVGRVIVLPSGRPPWKAETLSKEARDALVKATFEGHPALSVSALEIERAGRTQGPTYSFESIESLRSSEAAGDGSRLAFVIGSDAVPGLSGWHRFPRILGLCHWIVLGRKGASEEEARSALRSFETSGLLRTTSRDRWAIGGSSPAGVDPLTLAWIETEAPAFSSTMIREHVARTGAPPDGMLWPAAEAAWSKLFPCGKKPA